MRRSFLGVLVSCLLVTVLAFGSAQSVFAYTVGHGSDDPVHEYTVEQALALYPNAEMYDYLSVMKAGARHEDLHDHITNRSGLFGLWVTITHFWDGDKGPYDPVDMVIVGEDGINAWQKAEILWGMAVGEYLSGDLDSAYEYLGHVAHLLADMSVPAHAHEDAHATDYYEDWMTLSNAQLTEPEKEVLQLEGPVDIPNDTFLGPLYYLFYTMNQIADFFPSDDEPGDDGWDAAYGDWIGDIYDELQLPHVNQSDLDKVESLRTIRKYSYLYAIRSTAALFKLFHETVSNYSALTVVVNRIQAISSHDDFDAADFFVRVCIDGFWFVNEGNYVDDQDDISPGWAFARNVGLTGSVPVTIQVWDYDTLSSNDQSDIEREPGRDLNLTVNLDTGFYSGGASGICGPSNLSYGTEAPASYIYFRIIMPNVPPTANAGPDQTVDEGDLVTLYGTFTDPNWEDTHTFLWQLVSSTNGQEVPDATTQLFSFTPNDDGVYTFLFTVTDNRGAQGSDTVVVTAENVPPEVSIDSLTDELGAEIGADVPFALAGLEVSLAASFTDAGTADTHIAVIDWGDGSTDTDFSSFVDCTGGTTGTLTTSHIYATPDNYTITLYVIDDDGGVGPATAQIEVVDAAGGIEHVIETLTPLADEPNIQIAIDKLQGNQDGDDGNGALDMLEKGNLNAALEKIKQALEYLVAAEIANPSLDLTYEKNLLALAGKSTAVGAITEAEAVAFRANDLAKIERAKSLVSQGDVLLVACDHVGAVGNYQEAVREVQNIK